MNTGDIFTFFMSGFDDLHNIVKRHGGSVDNHGVRWRGGNHSFRHERACIKTIRATFDQSAAFDGNEIRITRPCADKINSHVAIPFEFIPLFTIPVLVRRSFWHNRAG